MKKKKITTIILIGLAISTVAFGAVILFNGYFVSAVEASVSEIVSEPAAYDSQPVITEGTVTDWQIRQYNISIVGPGINKNYTVLRYYLVIEDLLTEEKIKVRLNYGNKSLGLNETTFTANESIRLEGIVKEFTFESLEIDLDIDLVIIAKQIIKENGEVIDILTDAEIEAFRARRQGQLERRRTLRNQVRSGNINKYIKEVSVEVIKWEMNEYNVTIQGPDDFYRSRIYVHPLLLVRNVETDAVLLVKVKYPRLNSSLSEDFISEGEIITLRGIIRGSEFLSEKFGNHDIEFEGVMFAISITNSDETKIVLVSKEIFLKAREHGFFKLGRGFRFNRLGRRRILGR